MASLAGILLVPFHDLEKSQAQKNFQYSLNSLQNELKFLDRLLFDWSAWDATADFISGKDPDYIQENLSGNTQQEQNLNVFCLIDTKGKPIWERSVNFYGKELRIVELSMFSEESLKINPILWDHKDPNSCVAGYCSTEGGVLMVVARPVTDNDNTGPVHGTLIMGRFITDQYIASITKQTCLGFDWWNLKKEYTRSAVNSYLSQITPQKPIFLEFDEDTVAAYAILPGVDGADAVLIKSTLPNDVTSYKNEFLMKSAFVFLIESLLFLIALTAGVARRCIRCRPRSARTANSLPTPDISVLEHILDTQNVGKDMSLTGTQQS
jgi:sensor domain CHASE-containing protein